MEAREPTPLASQFHILFEVGKLEVAQAGGEADVSKGVFGHFLEDGGGLTHFKP